MRKETRTIYYSDSGEMFDTALAAIARDAEDACSHFVDEPDSEVAVELATTAISALQAWLKAKAAKDAAS